MQPRKLLYMVYFTQCLRMKLQHSLTSSIILHLRTAQQNTCLECKH
jgi:hypothetical protein